MNLLELMLEERVIFPAYAQYAVQDYTGRIKFSDKKPVCNEKYFAWEGCWCSPIICDRKRLDNWHSDIVTRDQYRDAGGSMEVDEVDFTPFVSVEDAQECKAEHAATANQQSVDATLTERGNRYGKFKDHAELSQKLKEAMYCTDGWEYLSADMREALEMIQHKVARILNGDPTYADSWHDIAGYAKLVDDRLSGVER